MKYLKIATSNHNKIKEIESILGEGVLQSVIIDLTEIQHENMLMVAEHKAKEAYNTLGEAVLIEDTSVCIESMDNLPGPFIKWFLKALGNKGIIQATDRENRKAKAVTILCLYNGSDYICGKGEIEGTISLEERGSNGFGWDTIFVPNGQEIKQQKTFAEMTLEEKNIYSMRRKAVEDFKEKYTVNTMLH